MKKFLLLLVFFSASIFPQFNPAHKLLVKTTFKREFNQKILNKYLNSNNKEDVTAALLAVSHSENKNFIPQIINCNFDIQGKYITFALGQLGSSLVSESYLLSKLTNSKYIDDILIALGKCGTKNSFNFIKENAKKLNLINTRGFYISLYSYMLNKHILTDKEKIDLILNNLSDEKQILSAQLFALARTGVNNINCTKLIFLLKNIKDPELIVAALSVLRRSPFIPESVTQFANLFQNDWRVRNELVRLYSKINFKTQNELELFFSFLNDKNKNISKETAYLIGNITVDKTIEKNFKSLCYSYICQTKPYKGRNRLLKSFCKKYDVQDFVLIGSADKTTYFEILEGYKKDSDKKFNLLLSKNKNLSNYQYLAYTRALLSLQNKLNSQKFKNAIFSLFKSNNAPSIFITSTRLDSLFIKQHSEKLEKITNAILLKKINDPHFSEALSGILTLSRKISKEYYNFCLEKLLSSALTENKNIARKIRNLPLVKRNDDKLFEKIWKNAFKYTFAKIITNKGEFVIKLKPEFAPISVGNFITLAKDKYFDNVVFHRVVSNFVIQTGDPSGTGWGGPGYLICSEFSPLQYIKGAVGMASSGKDTEGSQWYVMHSHFPHLNRKYSNFGIVENGIEVVNNIQKMDKIEKIKLIK